MRRIFLPIIACLLFVTSCTGTPTPTATTPALPVQPSVVPSPSSAPTPILTDAGLMPLAVTKLDTQTGTSYSLAWTPDGETLSATGGVEIILLSKDLNETLANLKPSSGALTVTWSADQERFATVVGARNPTISLWDWDASTFSFSFAQEISAGADQYGVSWSPDGKLLASLANDRKATIQIWDAATWELLKTHELPYTNPRRAMNWSSDSKTLYDAGELDGQAVAFALNVEDGTVRELAKLPPDQVYAFGVSPDTKKFAVADERGHTQIFDTTSGAMRMEFESVSEPVSLAWHPNGKWLAILGYKSDLQLWDVE